VELIHAQKNVQKEPMHLSRFDVWIFSYGQVFLQHPNWGDKKNNLAIISTEACHNFYWDLLNSRAGGSML
jgi:hypothetical protein